MDSLGINVRRVATAIGRTLGQWLLGERETEAPAVPTTLPPQEEGPPASEQELPGEAYAILTELLARMGIRGQVTIYDSVMQTTRGKDGRRSYVLDISTQDASLLIGRGGTTLEALELLVRLMVGQRLHSRPNIGVDVDGYHSRRYRTLRRLAVQMADRVRLSREPLALEAMPPQERRVIHLALRSDPAVTTKSVGQGKTRRVVVRPRGMEVGLRE